MIRADGDRHGDDACLVVNKLRRLHVSPSLNHPFEDHPSGAPVFVVGVAKLLDLMAIPREAHAEVVGLGGATRDIVRERPKVQDSRGRVGMLCRELCTRKEGDEDDDAVTVKSLASSGGATYGSGVQTLFNAQDEDEEDEEDDDDDGRGRGRNETQSLHDILDLDDQYNAALEKLRTANISSSAATAVANDYDDSTHNSSLAASIARKNAAQNKDEVTETAKAAAMFAATAALYSHSGLNAVPNSGGKNTNKSSTSEVSSGTTSKSGGKTPAAALCVDDESDQGQVFRTPVLVVSDHPDALSSSDEDKELDGEGSMQNALDRVFFGDDDEDEVDSPSGFGTTTTKKRGENKMSFLNALPP